MLACLFHNRVTFDFLPDFSNTASGCYGLRVCTNFSTDNASHFFRGSVDTQTHGHTRRKDPRIGYRRREITTKVATTAAAPASEVEAVVRCPTNMAAAKIAAVDFNKTRSI